jgi:hypothetical protein
VSDGRQQAQDSCEDRTSEFGGGLDHEALHSYMIAISDGYLNVRSPPRGPFMATSLGRAPGRGAAGLVVDRAGLPGEASLGPAPSATLGSPPRLLSPRPACPCDCLPVHQGGPAAAALPCWAHG